MKKILFALSGIFLIFCLASCSSNKAVPSDGPTDAVLRSVDRKTAPSTNPDAITAFNQGAQLFEEGDYGEAEFYLRQAISFDDGFVDAYDYLGIVLRRLGETDEAIEILKKSINIDTINIVPYNSLAIAYLDIGDYKNAEKICDDAIKNIPDCADGYFQKGIILIRQEKYKDAATCLEEAYSIYRKNSDDQYFEAAYSLGSCYYALENWNKAVKYLDIALKQFPDDENLKLLSESAKENR